MMNICAKFHRSPSTEYRDIGSHEMGVNRWKTRKYNDCASYWCQKR